MSEFQRRIEVHIERDLPDLASERERIAAALAPTLWGLVGPWQERFQSAHRTIWWIGDRLRVVSLEAVLTYLANERASDDDAAGFGDVIDTLSWYLEGVHAGSEVPAILRRWLEGDDSYLAELALSVHENFPAVETRDELATVLGSVTARSPYLGVLADTLLDTYDRTAGRPNRNVATTSNGFVDRFDPADQAIVVAGLTIEAAMDFLVLNRENSNDPATLSGVLDFLAEYLRDGQARISAVRREWVAGPDTYQAVVVSSVRPVE